MAKLTTRKKPRPHLTPGGAFHSDMALPLEFRRREHAAALVEMIREARESETYSPLPALTKQLADLTGLNKQAAPRLIKLRPEPADLLDALRERLADTQQLRLRASREGSYVAARDLLRMEADLVISIAAEVAARAPTRESLTDAELVEALAADIQTMPPVLRRQLLALVQAAPLPAGQRAH
jgi:hypothetical protein